MPTWGEILKEVNNSAMARGPGGPDFDAIRDKYIERLHALTGRAVIVYASGWLRAVGGDDADTLVEPNDVHALMEVCHHVPERELDLILHSPGGSAQAAEQMVNYLRTQFDYIRALVPLQAKSAATMIALGCDEIVLGNHSELGPIDPQIFMPVPGGTQRLAPAHAILHDFERAKREIAADLTSLPVWTPILQAYAGGLLDFCSQQISLSQDVVAGWLGQHMLAHADAEIPPDERERVARDIAEYFGSDVSYERFRTHGRPIRIEELRGIRGLRVQALEDNDDLQDALLSIYHALDFTFGGAAAKIVENHHGARYVRIHQRQIVIPAHLPPSGPTPPPVQPTPRPTPKPTPGGTRKQSQRGRGRRSR